MTVEYANRQGDTYYLQSGKTRTGKPRYWFGRKQTGEPVERVPAGFEIYEHPERGLVFLRKIRPTEISQLECDVVSDGIRRFAGLKQFIVDVEPDGLVVYLPSMGEDEADQVLDLLQGPLAGMSPGWQAAKDQMIRASNHTKMMRFTLLDPDERIFVVHRWCFRGSIDDWIEVGGPAPLADLVRRYGQHLGKESFFDLM